MLTLKALLLAAFIASTPILSGAEDTDDVTIETVSEDVYESPTPPDWSNIYLAEHFDNARDFEKKWIKSTAKKEGIAEDIAKYDGEWSLEGPQKSGLKGDLGLVMKSKAKHAAIASKLLKPFVFNKNPLVVQYEVLLQDGQECGGSYLKLLTGNVDLGKFHDKTPYSIMFGPDKCGNDHKLHFIFNHKNPLNGSVTEKHCKKPKERIEEYFSDRLPHLYTLILNPDNTFEIRVDNKPINSGNLLEDFEPPVNPPKTILDPEDKKPEDWDDREKIPDPTAVKPEDWDEDAPAQIIDEFAVKPDDWLEDEPVYIPDPKAVKPEDWDDSMDGVWEPPAVDNPKCEKVSGCGPWKAPMVDNPNYKGKWRAPMIDNPNYKGKWKAREIPNPDYYNDSEPFKMFTVTAIGFELWSMSQDILFDNILITDSIEAAEKWAADSFDKKRQKLATESTTFWGRMMRKMNYKPKIWAVYTIYCSIPIFVYGWYLWKCVKEESVVQKIANVTNEHPWLWFVYIGVLVLVVLLLVFFCQKPAAKDSRAAGGDASETYGQDKKKTDEATEDDKEPLVNEKKDVDDEYAEKNSDPDDDDDEEEEEEEEDAAEPEVTKETARKRNVQKD